MTTAEQIEAVFSVMQAIREALWEAGADGIPAGHLYSMLSNFGCSIQQYETIESAMLDSGMVKKQGNLLTAI